MSILTIEGFDVRVEDAPWQDVPWGDVNPAFSGMMRSDVRARHRTFQVTTVELEEIDALALRLILRSPGPLRCSGPLVDANLGSFEADCHCVGPIRTRPITATDAGLQFTLRETAAEDAVLLYSFDADAPGSYTHTRTGAVGKYTDSDGVLQDAAADTLRREYLWLAGDYDGPPDTVAGLFEAARTNLVDSDDISAWSASGTPVVTGSISDPAGGTGAYTVEDDDGAGLEFVLRNISFTGDGTKTLAFVVRENTMPASGTQVLKIQDTAAGASRLTLAISAWTDGEPTVAATTGTLLGKRYAGNGYWVLYAQTTSVTAANTNRIEIQPANTAAATGSIDVYRVNAFNNTIPSYSILDAGETRNADTHESIDISISRALSVYVKHLEVGTVDEASGFLWRLGIGGATPRITIVASGGVYVGQHNSVAATNNSTMGAAPSWGDVVEHLLTVDDDGIPTLYQSIDEAAETTGTGGVAQAFADEDAATYLGPQGGNGGMNPILKVRVVAGVRTMAQMRKLASARLYRREAA